MLPKLRKPCNLERIVSLKEFLEKEAMSLLGFEVTLAYLTFLALFHFLIYILVSFPKSLLSISLKVIMFSKSLFKFHVVNISTLHVLIC
jgi:hypothetical protein